MNKFTKGYKQHIKDIKAAQQEFELNPTQETATKLSDLKNNLFRKPEQVFTPGYIKEMTKDFEPATVAMQIQYEKELYSSIAQDLKVTGEKIKEEE